MPPHTQIEQVNQARDRAYYERALDAAQGVKALLHTLGQAARRL